MTNEYIYRYEGSGVLRNYATVGFGVAIALLGAVMMTLTSSPVAKGAAFLWLPAALQLMAGVWLGPIRGMFAGGLGAYAAGILAYGGWGLPDIIMNPVAGGLANSMLPGYLFRWLRIDPDFGSERIPVAKGLWLVLGILTILIGLAFALKRFDLGWIGYIPPLVLLLLVPLALSNVAIHVRDFALAVFISISISLLSAAIGVLGTVVAGQSWQAAVVGTGVGWFLGDTASCILGLYMLASFTERARRRGLAPYIEVGSPESPR